MSDDDFGLMWQSTQAACPTLADLMKQACQEPLSSGSSLDSQSSTNSNPSSSSGSSLGSQQKRPRTRPPRRAAPVQTEEQKYLAAKLERMVKNAYVNAKSTPSQPAPTLSSRVTVAATARQASRNRDDAMDMDVDDQQPGRRVERIPRAVAEDVDMQLDDAPTTTGARLYPRLPSEDKQHHAPRPHTSSSRHSTTLSASASSFPASSSSSFAPASSTTNPPTFAKPSNPKSSARLPASTSTKALGMRRSLPPTTSTTTGSGSRTFKPPLAPTKAASVPSLPVQQPRKPLAEVQQQTTTVSVVIMPKPTPKPELKQTVLPESDEDDAGSSNDSFGIDLDIVEAVLSQYD
ncbi:hypothetical protein EXIGLDRAFT_745314 [Exidia glandulosa HHB12029]|uniref:Uncharacterized protein n=1 Tax=Exidia glandulosa HHB12029 TaxID=1314781 RepID=A0A165NSD1_EXIGL|nr:hypothetical protein EXIGLDRAFT_745314 [Exidia glandulosa HHB12029]